MEYNDFLVFISGQVFLVPIHLLQFPNGSINIGNCSKFQPSLPITISSGNNVLNSNYYINNTNKPQTLLCNGFTAIPSICFRPLWATYHIDYFADGSDANLDSWCF